MLYVAEGACVVLPALAQPASKADEGFEDTHRVSAFGLHDEVVMDVEAVIYRP